jgi:hypothetical protein
LYTNTVGKGWKCGPTSNVQVQSPEFQPPVLSPSPHQKKNTVGKLVVVAHACGSSNLDAKQKDCEFQASLGYITRTPISITTKRTIDD